MSPHRKINTAELEQKAVQSISESRARQPHVNYLTGWLMRRTDLNGFGDDFELTIRTRRATT